MTLEKAKQELEKFVKLKTTLRPAFVDVLLNAEEVVRCKECRHFSKYLTEEEADGVCWHNNSDFEVTFNHFCAWGERREDGK